MDNFGRWKVRASIPPEATACMLWSSGKGSTVMIWLSKNAFLVAREEFGSISTSIVGMLNVIDEFTHECLAIPVARKLKARSSTKS